METINKQYLTVDEAAQYLRISRASFYKVASENKIPSIRIGRRRVFNRHDLDDFYSSLKN